MSAILVMQPDPELATAWSDALGRSGHDVLEVRTLADAITCAREGGLDVVVVDATGRDDDPRHGDEVVRELVAELERLPEPPPMILVSASPRAPELSAQVGAAGFLPKPLAAEDLVELVARVASATVRTPVFEDEATAPRLKDF